VSIDKTLIGSRPLAVRPLPEEDDGGLAIKFSDLPGCISDGSTPEEALKNGGDAVKA